jgi:hypothetical protein
VKHKRVEHPTLVGSDEHNQVIGQKAAIAKAGKDAAAARDTARTAKDAAAAAAKEGAARVKAALAEQRSANDAAPGKKKVQKQKKRKAMGGPCPVDLDTAEARPAARAPAWHSYPMIFGDVSQPAPAPTDPPGGFNEQPEESLIIFPSPKISMVCFVFKQGMKLSTSP